MDRSHSKWEWSFVSNAWPRFYNENEDQPSKPVCWRLEIEAGNVDTEVGHSLELLGDRSEQRVTFRAGPVWSMKFPDIGSYNSFWNDYNNKLFENLYGEANTQANRETFLGKDFASTMFTEEAEKIKMEWEEEPEESMPLPRTPIREAFKTDDSIQLVKVGIKDNSFLFRGQRVNALRNVEGGVIDQGAGFVLKKADGSILSPSRVMLADHERRMGLLDHDDPYALCYADVETGKVVQEWNFKKDDVDIPMTDIVPETKNAPAEDRTTFLSFDTNRICRWDTRDPSGVVQSYSPELDYVSGKDYSKNTNFTCMATTGDGSVVVGSKDGKVRLYSNKLSLKKASTAFPGIGTPITHIDVTFDGKWVVATTDYFIEVIKTTATDDDGKPINGFHKSLSVHASPPKLLKLRAEDRAMMGDSPFKKAKFTFVTESGIQERWIVTTCGMYSVLWNFRQVKAHKTDHRSHGGVVTFTTYHLVGKDEQIVDSCFCHERQVPSGNRPATSLVVTTPNKVWSSVNNA